MQFLFEFPIIMFEAPWSLDHVKREENNKGIYCIKKLLYVYLLQRGGK